MLVRRVAVTVPVLLALAVGSAPAVAADPHPWPDLGRSSERAVPGAATARAAGTVADGVVRRTARLDEAEHTSTNPQHQLAAVDVALDLEAQTFGATASFNAAPADADAILAVVVGTWDGGSCRGSFYGLSTTVSGQAEGQFADGTTVAMTTSRQGAQVSMSSAPHPALRDTVFECAYALVVPPDPNAPPHSRALADELDETYRPVLEVEAEERMVGAKKGTWARLGIEVRNTSPGEASGVRLTASGAGIELKTRTIDVGVVGGDSTEYVDLDVRLRVPKKKSKKVKPRTLTLTVTGTGAAAATGTTTIVLTPRPTVPKKLTGTYWWGWESTNLQSSAGWVNHAVWFVDRKWAYLGWAEGRKPRCSAKVKECQRYSYNPRTGRLRLGKQKAKVTSEGFAFRHPDYDDKLRVEPLTLPKKGTELAVDLYHQNWSGVCAIMCTAYTDYLTMDKEGRFVEGGYAVGSWPGLGSTWGSAPPDERGTYKVVRTGVIELRYADGTKKRHVIGIQHDPSGKPNPAVAGVLLGDKNFYD